MYKKSSFLKPLSVIASVMTLVGCGTLTPTPRVLNPAKVPEVAKLESVAISSFEGKDGALFKSELQSMLLTANEKLFKVVNSPEKAEGVFSGQVTESSVGSRTYSKEVEDCERKGAFKACKEGTKRKYNVQCVERTANFQVVVSVTKVKTGEVIYTKRHSGEHTDTYCKNQSSTPASESSLLQKARAEVLQELRNDVAPYYTGGKIPLLNPSQWLGN
ncbi:MAG: hypothetical protein ABFS56_22025 [Pseudomonadota bacterium]